MTPGSVKGWVVPGGMALSLFAMLGYLMLAGGGAAGAEAAVNESVSMADLEQNLSSTKSTMQAKLYQNATEMEELVIYNTAGWMAEPLLDMWMVGVDFGYGHPRAGKFLGRTAQPVVFLWAIFWVNRMVKTARRNF